MQSFLSLGGPSSVSDSQKRAFAGIETASGTNPSLDKKKPSADAKKDLRVVDFADVFIDPKDVKFDRPEIEIANLAAGEVEEKNIAPMFAEIAEIPDGRKTPVEDLTQAFPSVGHLPIKSEQHSVQHEKPDRLIALTNSKIRKINDITFERGSSSPALPIAQPPRATQLVANPETPSNLAPQLATLRNYETEAGLLPTTTARPLSTAQPTDHVEARKTKGLAALQGTVFAARTINIHLNRHPEINQTIGNGAQANTVMPFVKGVAIAELPNAMDISSGDPPRRLQKAKSITNLEQQVTLTDIKKPDRKSPYALISTTRLRNPVPDVLRQDGPADIRTDPVPRNNSASTPISISRMFAPQPQARELFPQMVTNPTGMAIASSSTATPGSGKREADGETSFFNHAKLTASNSATQFILPPVVHPGVSTAAPGGGKLENLLLETNGMSSAFDDPEAQTVFRVEATSQNNSPAQHSTTRADIPIFVGRQIAGAMQHGPTRPVEISLNPEELGRVRLSMSTSETLLNLQVMAERPETLELLRRHISILEQEFRSIGYENVTFSFAGSEQQKNSGQDHVKEGNPDQAETALEMSQSGVEIRLAAQSSAGLDIRL